MASDPTFDIRSTLEWYSATALRAMLRSRGDRREGRRSKADCVAALRDCLLDSDSIQGAIATLEPIAQEALGLLKRRGGSLPVAAMRGQLAVWHPGSDPSEIERVPSELVRRALAFWDAPPPRGAISSLHDVQRPAADNPQSVIIYSVAEILDLVPLSASPGPLPLLPSGSADCLGTTAHFQRRLLAFLRAVEDRAPRVLQSGLIGVRDRNELAQALDLPEDAFGRELDRRVKHLPFHPVNLFRTLLGALGIVEVSSDRRLRTSAAALSFARLAPARQAWQLLEAWLEVGENDLLGLTQLRCERRAQAASNVPDLERARQAHRQLIEIMRQQVRPGYWYRIADLSRVVRHTDVEFLVSWRDPTPYRWSADYADPRRAITPPYLGIVLEDARGRSRSLRMGTDWELVEGAFIQAVLRGPLTWLGLVSIKKNEEEEHFALTDLGAQVLGVGGRAPSATLEPRRSHVGALIVQPNFEVIVYEPEDRRDLLYQLDRFAERVSLDRIAVYRITRDSFCAGLGLGSRGSDLLSLLEEAARTPIPPNVAFTLRDWAESFEEIRWYRNAWLLEAPDRPTLDRWLEDPSLAAMLDRRIAPTLALFTGTPPEGLDTTLGDLGATGMAFVDANDPLSPCLHFDEMTTLRSHPDGLNLYARATLELIAERRPDHAGERYQVTPEAIRRATQAGLTPSTILSLLDTLTGQSLPGGLPFRVKGWAGAYPPFELGTVAILSTRDPESLRELREDPAFASSFIANVSSYAAIIRLDALDELRDALAKCGVRVAEYRPGPPAETFARDRFRW